MLSISFYGLYCNGDVLSKVLDAEKPGHMPHAGFNKIFEYVIIYPDKFYHAGDQRHMHIALNAHLLYFGQSYRAAGISRYIAGLIQSLQATAQGHHYSIFLGNQRPPVDFFYAAGFCPIPSRLPTHRPLVRIFWEQCLQPMALARYRPDLLHSLAFVSPLAWRGPTVVTIYDLSFLLYPERFHQANRLYLAIMTRNSARRARRVAAISQSTKADVIRLLGVPPERIAVVPPSLEPQFRPQDPASVAAFRQRYGLPNSFILYLGTLEPRKNLLTLLKAYAILKKRCQKSNKPGPSLILAGGKGWGYKQIFRAIEELGLAQEILLPGFIPFSELPLWYAAADLFVYPSLYEGFGLPVLEALACGTPVVCSRASSLPEAAGDAALLVDPQDVTALAEAMERLLQDDRLRSDLREKGLTHAARFSQKAMGQRMIQVYEEALQG